MRARLALRGEQRKGRRAEKRQESREKAGEQRKGIPGLANVTVLSAWLYDEPSIRQNFGFVKIFL